MNYAGNSIAEAPANLLDTQPGGTSPNVSGLQHEASLVLSSPNTTTGALFNQIDKGVEDGLFEVDDAEAKLLGPDNKAMPVTIPHSEEGLVSSDGDKQLLTIPSINSVIAQGSAYNTPAAQDAFDRMFDAKKDPVN